MADTGIGDHFARKRTELGMDRESTLTQVQAVLEGWYPGLTRAKKLHQGILRVVTSSASVAGDLRMRQAELLELVPDLEDVRLAISIGQLY